MSGKSSRDKGHSFERKICRMLSAELGIEARRNLDQARNGGGDVMTLAGWAIECKAQAKKSTDAWWRQAVAQAGDDKKPALIYKIDYQPIRCVVRLSDISPDHQGYPVEMEFDALCHVIRESMGAS